MCLGLQHCKGFYHLLPPRISILFFVLIKMHCLMVIFSLLVQCVSAVKLDGEIGSLISEGPWVFAGLQNAIKAWNIQTNVEIVLTGPKGLVNAMVVGDDILFAGVQDGSILGWKSNSESVCPMASLNGHAHAVLSLVVGGNMLYSGSKDDTIRVCPSKTLL